MRPAPFPPIVMPMPTILWFRNDLRLDDNPALRDVLDSGDVPICVYISAPREEGDWAPGAASNAWRDKSLRALDADLRARGSRLRFFHGPTLPTLRSLVATTGATAVRWNRRYDPASEVRDAKVKKALLRDGVDAQSCNGALLAEPWTLATKSGTPFRVFTPFWKSLLAQWQDTPTWDAPESIGDVENAPEGVAIEALCLASTRDWDTGFWTHFQPGEAGAREALDVFRDGALRGYDTSRNRPDQVGTSQLSPHLHFGEIAPWRVASVVQAMRGVANANDIDSYVRELGWREFGHYLLHHFPETPHSDFSPAFASFKWARPDATDLLAWQRGCTGVPIVDAGMRQLWHTGWMHNRVRMIVASYLTKHMRMHWREGARWFWDTLVDADLANNTLGWQWVAGTGADAAPYFRVFNPVTQAQRFDPDATYITHWIPELAALPVRARFAPWTDPAALRALGIDYPYTPLVDLDAGRDAALAAFRQRRD